MSKVTSSFGKRPIKVVEQVVCSTDDIERWKLEARIDELMDIPKSTAVRRSLSKAENVRERLAELTAQLAALRGETV